MRGEAGNKKSLWYFTFRIGRIRGAEPPDNSLCASFPFFAFFSSQKIQRKSSEKQWRIWASILKGSSTQNQCMYCTSIVHFRTASWSSNRRARIFHLRLHILSSRLSIAFCCLRFSQALFVLRSFGVNFHVCPKVASKHACGRGVYIGRGNGIWTLAFSSQSVSLHDDPKRNIYVKDFKTARFFFQEI